MEFLQQNMMWVALAAVSGGMLLWPLVAGGTVAHLTPAEATLMMNREDALVLDVRETGEWSSGHISGARHITLAQLEKRMSELEKFKDNWNWEELSDNNCLTPELIDQFADYINWKALINNWSCCEKLATEEFIRKYSDRIPACDFKDSRLWRELVERKEKQIKKRICLC